ncbi:MAG: YhbY family RNA-binding protein [Azonexus sp.]|nr:YhbY family RNA-binding protein [Azonexus sp.]MDZ4315760.1 YhbY family RNA-binding protein [Azonexus sp.]
MLPLSSDERRELRARAHSLNPVVSIAESGLTEAVMKEIEISLKAHELIKIRVYGDSRENREAYFARICSELSAAPVQHIGKLLVVYRPDPTANAAAKAANASKSKRSESEPRRTKRSFQG